MERPLRGYRISPYWLSDVLKGKRQIWQCVDGPPQQAEFRWFYIDQETQHVIMVMEFAGNKYAMTGNEGFDLVPDGQPIPVYPVVMSTPQGREVA